MVFGSLSFIQKEKIDVGNQLFLNFFRSINCKIPGKAHPKLHDQVPFHSPHKQLHNFWSWERKCKAPPNAYRMETDKMKAIKVSVDFPSRCIDEREMYMDIALVFLKIIFAHLQSGDQILVLLSQSFVKTKFFLQDSILSIHPPCISTINVVIAIQFW